MKGLPALFGALGGIGLYAFNVSQPNFFLPFSIQLLCLAIIAVVSLFVGKYLLGRQPKLGFVVLEFWVLLAIAITSATTFLILWVGKASLKWFSDLSADDAKAVAGVLGGALTAFFALLWTKDIEEGKGFFWSSTHFKKALGTSLKKRNLTPDRNSKEFEVIYDDRVSGKYELKGWGFVTRWKRAKIISKYLNEKVKAKRTVAKKPATK